MTDRLAEIIDDPARRDRIHVFRDRREAGELLAQLLRDHGVAQGQVLAIPAGGVPVAVEVAERLNLPLDVAVVSKITLPWNTEAGYGAVAFDGTVQLNSAMLARAGLTKAQIDAGTKATRDKVIRRVHRFRGDAPPISPDIEPVILIDDGIASGFTYRVAITALRKLGVRQLIAAVPTAHQDALERLRNEVEAIYCVNMRAGWSFAVADAYARWHDVEEDDALALLHRTRHAVSSVA